MIMESGHKNLKVSGSKRASKSLFRYILKSFIKTGIK